VAEGVATLPEGKPDLTLGWGVIAHASRLLVQPNGPRAGKLWAPTTGQARFLLWWYAVDADGRWLFNHGVRRLAKGSGKSPFAAVMALMELVGPVRLADFDPKVDGGCVGKPVDMPLVQIAATAESQTANTMRMVRAMAQKRSRVVVEYGIDVGKTIFYTPTGGQLEVITSSASAAEGAEVTFAVEDETEHWTPTTGGQDLAQTLDRNLAKSGSRGVETANAWEPGAGSVAETSFDAWVAQQEGRTRGGARMLYDARIAPADTDLRSETAVHKALEFVYDDCFWIDEDGRKILADRIWDLRTPEDVSRRFYFNQPTASDGAWVTPMQWAALADAAKVVADGEQVALFFDGSKSRDATALVGCRIEDGHIFTLGVWEPDPKHTDTDTVPVEAVDFAVRKACERYDVAGFFADVREWESFAKVSWPNDLAESLLVHAVAAGTDPQPIAWDMRSHWYEFGTACELTRGEVLDASFTHDGDSRLARHVANARIHEAKGVVGIRKESPASSKKIDAAVCMVGARMVRRRVLAAAPKKVRTGRSYIR
jgi:hypothetical protein